MQSLRTRRPSDGRQKQPRQQQKLSKAPSNAGMKQRSLSTRKSRVDDKIKKRMSMRYADISAPRLQGDGGVPAVPSLPVGAYAAGMGGSSGAAAYGYEYDDEGFRDTRERVDVREADMRAFERDNFDPDACESAYSASKESCVLT